MLLLGKCVHAILRIPREERNFDLSFTNHPILNQGRLPSLGLLSPLHQHVKIELAINFRFDDASTLKISSRGEYDLLS